jgi:hypothetical protein
MFEWTAVHGSGNCWSGITGEMSQMIRELLRERDALLALVEHHQREAWRRGLISAGYDRHDIHRKESST